MCADYVSARERGRGWYSAAIGKGGPVAGTLVGIGMIVEWFLEEDLSTEERNRELHLEVPTMCCIALIVPPTLHVKAAMVTNDAVCSPVASIIHCTETRLAQRSLTSTDSPRLR